ncbi:MAG: AAA family ATPase [Actinomycetota bacterium]
MTDSLLTGMRDGAWLDAQNFPPLEYAVPGIIPEGFGLLVAPPKAGKSWFVAGIGLGCALGGLVLGRLKVDQRPVCYWALEDGHRRLQSRFRHLMLGDGIPAGINVITQATTHQIVPMMAEFLLQHSEEAPLLILDTLGKVKPPKPPGADSYQTDYAIGAQLKACIDSIPGASLIVVHHSRKAESTDFVDSVSGTAGIAGSADFVLVLSRQRHSNEALLSVTGRDIAEAEYALRSDEGLWLLDGTDLASASATAEQRRLVGKRSDRSVDIAAAVGSSPTPVSATDIAEKLGIDNDTAGKYLRRLAADGVVTKTGRGLFKSVSELSEPSVRAGGSGSRSIALSESVSEPASESGSAIRTSDTSDTDRQTVIAEKLAGLHPQGGTR